MTPTVCIKDEHNLAKADSGKGPDAKSDPYCLVYWNDRVSIVVTFV